MAYIKENHYGPHLSELEDLRVGSLKESVFILPTAVIPVDVAIPERREPIGEETALALVEQEARHRGEIVTEGPPIYLRPLPGSTADYDHPTFQQGWKFTARAQGRLSSRRPRHFVMVDDVNIPKGEFPLATDDIIEAFGVAPGLRGLELLQEGKVDGYFRESSFTTGIPENDQCSDLDSRFQMEKIWAITKGLSAEEAVSAIRTAMFLVVHPVDFQLQQSAMLSKLLGQFKADPVLSKISKEDRRRIVEDLYVHVWVDDSGKVVSVTRPSWNGQKFVNEQIHYEN